MSNLLELIGTSDDMFGHRFTWAAVAGMRPEVAVGEDDTKASESID